ncbi:MAG: hypothetical protein M1165_02205 [Candidatus Pacearchaeota archaeon]|nr:hypothetical protein [Candidatus Pacearchaeota archaeon]
MTTTIIKSIDLARDVKDLILYSTVKFDDLAVRDKILATSDNDFLLITKSIDSDPKIISAILVDDDFIIAAIRG